MRQKAFKQANPILKLLSERGFRAYVVGGAVRDYILGRPIADVDIVTSASPEDVTELFTQTYRLSNQHQTIIVKWKGLLFELTSERGIGIEEDLKKRDFTINSLAINETGQIIDKIGGQVDLKEGILRSVDPLERMTEDPLRMLRALRFVSELGFHIEENLMNVLIMKHSLLEGVAVERIVKEFEKLIAGHYRNKALQILLNTEMYRSLIKLELTTQNIHDLQSTGSVNSKSSVLRWSMISYCLGWMDASPLKRLSLSNQLTHDVRERLRFFRIRQTKDWNSWLLYQAGLETAFDVESLRVLFHQSEESIEKILQLWEELPMKSKSDLAITGRDLLSTLKKSPGPWLKDELEWAERKVIEGECLNEKATLLDMLAKRREML
ncbi:CCA tRNA nucleotidyltransferase [Bacillus solitudinis]|uniref:CCA tRNA nucleotidyltransferase n=1 Tax=Bacillus solitudinis TaxID=2014074 RepID=UPI000C247BCC|nr:CCA tRNA nucleotidyltransferase [Bacillus solitudinis]